MKNLGQGDMWSKTDESQKGSNDCGVFILGESQNLTGHILSNLLWAWSWMENFQRFSPTSTTLDFCDWHDNSTCFTFVLFPIKTNLSTLKTCIPFGQRCPSAFNCVARRGEVPLKVQWLWRHLGRSTFFMNMGSGIRPRYSRGRLSLILLWKWYKWHQ